MKHVPATSKKDPADQRRAYFDYHNSTSLQPRARHRTLMDMLRLSIIERLERDRFAQRIWEDDGGGQAPLS